MKTPGQRKGTQVSIQTYIGSGNCQIILIGCPFIGLILCYGVVQLVWLIMGRRWMLCPDG